MRVETILRYDSIPMTRQPTSSPFSTVLVFVALSVIGLAMIPLLNIQLNPSRTSSVVTVNYYWPGSSAINLEQEVTSKLESLFSTMRDLQGIESTSDNGSGTIRLSFKKNADLDAVRFEIATIIRRIYPQLPPSVSYPVISLGTGGSKVTNVLTYTLASGAEPYYIRKYAEENIAPDLSMLPGVSDVAVSGASPFRYEIIFDLTKARSLDVSADEIAAAVNGWFAKNRAGLVMSDQDLDGMPEQYSLTVQSGSSGEPEWSKIPVKLQQGRILHLPDLARVRYKEQMPASYHRINGLNTINMTVLPVKGQHDPAGQSREGEGEGHTGNPSTGYSVILAYEARNT